MKLKFVGALPKIICRVPKPLNQIVHAEPQIKTLFGKHECRLNVILALVTQTFINIFAFIQSRNLYKMRIRNQFP